MSNNTEALIRRLKVYAEEFRSTVLSADDCIALIAALEQSQRANAAQDDHINQQADRIESLEKKNAELGGQLSRYSMSPGQADQRMCESRAVRDALGFGKDADNVAPVALTARIGALKSRIAELEELATDYGMKFQRAQDALKHAAILNREASPLAVKLPDPEKDWFLLNDYAEACAEAIRAAGGTVDEGE